MPFQKGNKLGKKFKPNEKHWHWKGGVARHLSGNTKIVYRWIKIGNEYIPEHRLIMEKYIGRKLNKNEVVHHKNKDGLDNRIDNLELMDRGKHNELHLQKFRDRNKDFVCSCGERIYFALGKCKKCYDRDYQREYARKKYGWKKRKK